MYPPLSWSQMHQFAFTIFNNGKQIRRVDGDKYCGFAYLYEASNIALPNSAKRRLPMLKALRSALLPYAQALSPSRDLSRDEYATTEFLCAFSRLTDSILLIGQDTDPEPHEFLLNPPLSTIRRASLQYFLWYSALPPYPRHPILRSDGQAHI